MGLPSGLRNVSRLNIGWLTKKIRRRGVVESYVFRDEVNIWSGQYSATYSAENFKHMKNGNHQWLKAADQMRVKEER